MLHREEVDTSELACLEEDLVCCLSSGDYQYLKVILVQCTNTGTLLVRVDSGGGSLVLICAEGLVLVMSSAGLSIMEQKVPPLLCDAMTVMWGSSSAGGVPLDSE